MPKPTLKLARKEEDRGSKAPVLLARPNRLVQRLGRTSRGYVLAGAGVVAASVGFVSLFSWLAPDSDRPIASPLEAVERILPDVLEQVDDQIEALLGTDGDTVLRDVRENLTAAGSRIPWAGERLHETATTGRSAGADPATPAPTVRSTSNTPAQGDTSSPTSSQSSPPSSPPGDAGETAPAAAEPPSSAPVGESVPPPATEAPSAPPVEEPVAPPVEGTPPPTEEPPAPPVEEPTPPAEEPPAEVPPPASPPPTTDEPAPPPTEEPPPTTDPPPAENPPPPPPRGPVEPAEG